MKYLKYFSVLVITGGLVWLFLMQVNFNQIREILSHLNPLFPILFFVGLIPQYLFRSYRWGLLLEGHKKGIRLGTLYHFTMIGFMISYTLPGRVGEVVRPLLLAEKENIRKSATLATVVVERLVDAATVFLLFMVFLMVSRMEVPLLITLKWIALTAFGEVVFLLLFFYFMKALGFFSRIEKALLAFLILFPRRMRERLGSALLNFLKSLNLDLNRADMVKLIITSLALWCSVIFSHWVLMRGFQIRIGIHETIPFFCLLYISAAIPTPGMIGSLDEASRIGLTGFFQVPVATAVAYTLMFHFLFILLPVLLGLAAFWHEGLNMVKIKRIKR